jgi:nitroreductase
MFWERSSPVAVSASSRTSQKSPGYWPVDCAAAAQNMLLAAHGLELGAVWTGVWPRKERMEGFHHLFDLPETGDCDIAVCTMAYFQCKDQYNQGLEELS